MFSIKTIKSDFPESSGKRFKIIVNARWWIIWIYNINFYELFKF